MKCTECDREQTLHGLCLTHLKASLRPQEENTVAVEDPTPSDVATSDEEEE